MMKSYVLDNLVKYHCFECNSEFILSEYQVQNAKKKIICPLSDKVKYDVGDITKKPEDQEFDPRKELSEA